MEILTYYGCMLYEGSYRLGPCYMEVPIDWDHYVWRFIYTGTMLYGGSYRLGPCCMEVPIDWDHAVWRFL